VTDSNFTLPASAVKSPRPEKPYLDFPLFPHATGRWAKKIKGRLVYFGPWDDPQGALNKYLEQRDDLHAGRRVRPDPGAVTVNFICSDFLNHKQALLDAGELSPHTWVKYETAAALVSLHFGKGRLAADVGPDDFAGLRRKMAARWGVYRLADMIQHVRSIFKYGHDARLLPGPVSFGPGFARPSKKAQRLHKAARGPKLLTAEEVRQLIELASIQVRAMLLLGINCGLGNADCGQLPLTALDLDVAMLDFPRPKTGIARRCPLWPETVQALREVLAQRHEAKDSAHAGLVFITRCGHSWARVGQTSPLVLEFRKLLKAAGIEGRKGLGFYTLRHVHRTISDGARDQPAADFIMGHEVAHMSSVYREGISDDRLRAVAEHVRRWLFGPTV
jgi:integrase